MLLVGIEEKNTPNALTVPRRGDLVTWAVGFPAFSNSTRTGVVERVAVEGFEGYVMFPAFSNSTRTGVVERVAVEGFEEYVFDARMENGMAVWGYLGNLLTVNGEPVPNATMLF